MLTSTEDKKIHKSIGMRLLLKPCAFMYRLLTAYGPVPRYPCLYWPFRKYINRYVSALWRKNPGIGLPDSGTELMISSPGHCASHSLVVYMQKHNPERRILLCSSHAPAPVLYAVRHGIPCLILSRDLLDYMAASHRSEIATGGHNPVLYFKMIIPHLDRLVTACFDEVTTSPAEIVRRINDKYGLDLNEGDNQLPQVKVYRSRG